jgi:hypothetical protein
VSLGKALGEVLDSGMRLGVSECVAEIKSQALMCFRAEVFEAWPVPLEIGEEHLR